MYTWLLLINRPTDDKRRIHKFKFVNKWNRIKGQSKFLFYVCPKFKFLIDINVYCIGTKKIIRRKTRKKTFRK